MAVLDEVSRRGTSRSRAWNQASAIGSQHMTQCFRPGRQLRCVLMGVGHKAYTNWFVLLTYEFLHFPSVATFMFVIQLINLYPTTDIPKMFIFDLENTTFAFKLTLLFLITASKWVWIWQKVFGNIWKQKTTLWTLSCWVMKNLTRTLTTSFCNLDVVDLKDAFTWIMFRWSLLSTDDSEKQQLEHQIC